jgi:cytidylate kinase
MSKPFHIAIDGPVAAGCSTVARLIADRLGFLFIDTGAMYRMAALLADEAGVDPKDEAKVVELINHSKMDMHHPTQDEEDGRLLTVLLNQEDVSWKIRTENISKKAAVVSAHPAVRKILVKKQQQIAKGQNVVMEGRDIAYNVLPNAQIKIFMTASEVVRTKRRLLQEQSKGHDVTYEEVNKELRERDERDTKRETDPLKIVNDAWVIDTSDLTIQQVINAIEFKVKCMMEVNGQ